VRPAAKVFVAGYSQGGHAAFAAADLRVTYAPEVPLAGVVGFAATCDVATLLREGPVYAPFILYSYSLLYGPKQVDPFALLQERWARTLAEDANRLCVNEFQSYYPADCGQLYRPEFHKALFGGILSQSFPLLSARLAENSSGLSGHRLPALIVQGAEDIVITTASQDRFVDALRDAGSRVRYLLYPGARHKHTRPAGFADSVAWMELVIGGGTPPDDGRVPAAH
jgi:acetyl esterase/lipase